MILNDDELRQVAQAITRIEQRTDAEVVTVLAPRADNYAYIPLLWASAFALVVPGLINYYPQWLSSNLQLIAQWLCFIVLALVFRIPAVTARLIPRQVREWRASNLARRQFLALDLHHTAGETGVLIFVSEAERYVEILVDRGVARHIDDATWEPIIAAFTREVRAGHTAKGFLQCIEQCGDVLARHLPCTGPRNELPDRLVVLDDDALG